ncbi:hypothetical protein [Neisseria leonii]|uniref:hypothetical protein n=1 Tax=Neisseria leonii TaxID=2995413 RepID=UPI00237B10C9|nr:hypothetical protein [Neisseria sp. 3986]MDD9326494.1 hypothetical protein [Neisseria sp. 3986]
MDNDNDRGAGSKTIEQVIRELKTFGNQHLIVMVSDDGGETLKPVKLIGKEFQGEEPYCTFFIEK